MNIVSALSLFKLDEGRQTQYLCQLLQTKKACEKSESTVKMTDVSIVTKCIKQGFLH